MYSTSVCRWTGWIFFILGASGLLWGHIGDYVHVQRPEGILSLLLGGVCVYGARMKRHRDTALIAALCGSLFIAWIVISYSELSMFSQADAFETLLRALAALWCLYASIHDVLLWRNQPVSNT